MEPNAPDPTRPHAPIDSQPANDGFLARWWPRAQPLVQQTWVNLRVWIPFFMNPDLRDRRIRYWAREHREGMTWKIALPSQCWHCRGKEMLRSREYDVEVKAFEYALEVVAGTAAAVLLVWLFALWLGSWKLLVFSLFLAAAGVGIVMVKSWTEQVRLVMWTCRDHADQMRQPELAVNQNELHVFLPTISLAQATQAELEAERRRLAGARPGGVHTDDVTFASDATLPMDHPRPRPAGPVPPAKPDLPPIKLVGDDEEPAS